MLLNVVIFPTMMLKDNVFIGISSRPVDENSPMYMMMRKVYPETGKPVIRTRVFGTVCGRCQRQGIRDCKHDLEEAWSSQKQSHKVRLLMQDRKDMYLREMRNEDVGTNITPAFPPERVNALNNTKRDYHGTEEHDYVFVAIDPAAGGNKSKYAIISMLRVKVRDDRISSGYRQDVVVRLLPHFCFSCALM